MLLLLLLYRLMMAVTYVIYGVASIGLWETLIEQIERDDVTPPPQKKESN